MKFFSKLRKRFSNLVSTNTPFRVFSAITTMCSGFLTILLGTLVAMKYYAMPRGFILISVGFLLIGNGISIIYDKKIK